MSKTYIELCKNDKRFVKIDMWNNAGLAISPSAAYYEIKGSEKDNVIVPRAAAGVDGNEVYAFVTEAVTASAAEYDIYWEMKRFNTGELSNHCTKLLVIDTC